MQQRVVALEGGWRFTAKGSDYIATRNLGTKTHPISGGQVK